MIRPLKGLPDHQDWTGAFLPVRQHAQRNRGRNRTRVRFLGGVPKGTDYLRSSWKP